MAGTASCRIKQDITRTTAFLYFDIQTSGSAAKAETMSSQRSGSVIFSST